jgi:hypothetical protein
MKKHLQVLLAAQQSKGIGLRFMVMGLFRADIVSFKGLAKFLKIIIILRK